DLLGKLAGGEGSGVALLRAQRPLVLLTARDLVLPRTTRAVDAHVAMIHGAPQPVLDHRVDDLAVAHAVAQARLIEQVRRVAHALHAAGDDDLRLARVDQERAQVDRFEGGAADLVNAERGYMRGQASLEGRLPR